MLPSVQDSINENSFIRKRRGRKPDLNLLWYEYRIQQTFPIPIHMTVNFPVTRNW